MSLLLEPVKVTVKESLPEIRVGSLNIDAATQGQSVEIPRWAAEILIEEDLAEANNDDLAHELFKFLNREKIHDPSLITSGRGDFYAKARRKITAMYRKTDPAARNEYDRLYHMFYDLVGLRAGKILRFVSATSASQELRERLAPEEAELFEYMRLIMSDWRSTLMGDDTTG
jgi:hypothetical protein